MPHEAEKQKHMESEIREMISTLTQRLAHLQHVQKPAGSGGQQHDGLDDDEHGVKIITLAGSNVGATMRGNLDTDEKAGSDHHHHHLHGGNSQEEPLGTYVNSNFQAINNSIMLGGSYSTNDPGVHMDIISHDYPENLDAIDHHKLAKSKGKKKKDKDASKTNHHSQHSSD